MFWHFIIYGIAIIFVIFIFFSCVVLRIIRRYYHFPIPSILTRVIDNPWRRRFIQKPRVVADQVELEPGMLVVEIGPGKGSYTKAFAERVLPDKSMRLIFQNP